MIEEAVLLQVDATIIVGALIFLTVRTVSEGYTGKSLEESITLLSTYFTIFLLGLSVLNLLFNPTTSFGYSKVLTVASIFILVAPVLAKSRIIIEGLTTEKHKTKHEHDDDNDKNE
jgi:DMSO reductase anchor subunit